MPTVDVPAADPWLQEEKLIWEAEIARSTRRFERACRDGWVPPARTVARAGSQQVWAESRAVIEASRAICKESRSLLRPARRAGRPLRRAER